MPRANPTPVENRRQPVKRAYARPVPAWSSGADGGVPHAGTGLHGGNVPHYASRRESPLKAVAVATLSPNRSDIAASVVVPAESVSESSEPRSTLDVFRKVYGRNTQGVSVAAMEPMPDAIRKKRAKARRGKSAPPVRHRGRFYVPPLATDFEISLKVARTMARDGEISLADSLAATRMLLQKDSLVLGALHIAPDEAVFSEDIEDQPGQKERMAHFMSSQKVVLGKVRERLMKDDKG